MAKKKTNLSEPEGENKLNTIEAAVQASSFGADIEEVGIEPDNIEVYGARVHNLKNIDVTIPRNCFVVITGISGSGKSSLAFDTIYSEGQRRYLDSFSAYARQFIGNGERPDVEKLRGYRLLFLSNKNR